MMDLNDLQDLRICEQCNVVFMPTKQERESYLYTHNCSRCKKTLPE